MWTETYFKTSFVKRRDVMWRQLEERAGVINGILVNREFKPTIGLQSKFWTTKFFQFHAVYERIWQNCVLRPLSRWVHTLTTMGGGMLDPPLVLSILMLVELYWKCVDFRYNEFKIAACFFTTQNRNLVSSSFSFISNSQIGIVWWRLIRELGYHCHRRTTL